MARACRLVPWASRSATTTTTLDLAFSDSFGIHLLASQLGAGADAFVDVSQSSGIDQPVVTWGLAFFDWDNDKWLDLYVGSSHAAPALADRLFHNRGDSTFEDVSEVGGAQDPWTTHGVAYADYDHDGAVDIAIGSVHHNHLLFRNLGVTPEHNWLTLDLRGGGPVNRDAVGARAYVYTTDGDVRMQEVKLGSGFGGNNMLRLHFGLRSDTPDHIVLVWPDGVEESVEDPPVNTLLVRAYPE